MNKAIIIGNLGQDPEIRYTADGKPVANQSIATTEKYRKKDGQLQEDTEWHRIVLYNKPAELAGEYLVKGSKIAIEGKIKTRKWQDKQGNDKYTTEIVGFQMEFLGGNKPSKQKSSNPDASKPKQEAPVDTGFDNDFDDDIPF